MDPDDQLEKKIADFQALGKENPNVDVNMLMMNALQNQTQNQNLVSSKMRKWAYLVSVGAPPFGLLFALKFYYGDEDDAKHTAYVCIWLTVLGILLFWLSAKLIFSSSGASVQQIEQIKPSDIYQLTQ